MSLTKMDPQLKSLIGGLVKKLIGLLNLDGINQKINDEIKKNYDEGLEDVGVKFNVNLGRNPSNINLLQEFTFDNIKGMNNEIQERLRKELSLGLINNEPLPQIKDRVKNIMEVAESRAMTIARTETSRAENFGRLDGAKASEIETGIKLRKWLSITFDDRTSDVSKAFAAKYGSPEKAIPLDQNFKVVVKGKVYEGPAPPFMPNDRDVLMLTQV